ncbi:MAG: RHS repeat-associated core domain-containing protein, partial [Pseudomonadota bacterium]
YNAAFQPTGNVGPTGVLREITMHGLSRRGAKDGAFDPAHPNTDVTLRAGHGGTVETFADGGDWQSRWKPTAAGNWSAEGGRLIHKGDGSDSLTWQGTLGAGANALSFRLVPSEGQGVTLRLGSFELDWSDGYSARQDGSALTALLTPPQIARDWLVIFGDGAVLVFVDGQLLFSEKSAVGDGEIVLSLSKGGALIDLAMAAGVELGLTYCDTMTKPRQAHSLVGDDSVIAGAVFDRLHRRVATTKAIPWSFRASDDTPLLAYSKSFLDVDAFRAAMSGDWKMTGDVADYYTGRENGAVSDDKGYPYVGARYEASPRKRQIEVSRAGVRHAINLTVPAEKRATAQIAVGANTGDDAPGLPAGKYPVRTITGPMKSMTCRVNDPRGAKVAGSYHGPDGTRLTGTSGVRSFAEGPTAQLDVKLPKALIDGDESFKRTTVTNALRQTTSLTEPSVGQTQFISDDAGNLRFVRPPQAGEAAFYVYYRYDALGRMIEQGIVEGTWDAAALQAAANDPTMPSNGSAQITLQYSGDGSDPTLIGMKAESVTLNPAPEGASDDAALTVTERFGYDAAGHITEVSQAIDDEGPVTVRYAYDALSRLSRITPPSGAPLKEITYSRDGLGRVTAVGEAAGGSEFGRYVYTANGDLQTETLGGAWTRSFVYQPDGALASVSTKGQGEDGLDMTFGYDADGMMTARDMVFAGGLGERFTDTVEYDAQRRIKSASGSSDAQYGAYDANGNILEATEGGKTSTFTLEKGSDRLASAAIEGAEAASITWTPQGCMAEGLGRTFAYDRASGATTMVTTKAGKTRFAYGGLRQRVVKRGPEGKTVYLHGTGRTPVARNTPRGMEVEVLGPTGLIAVVSDKARFPITDTQGSVWAVADEKGIVATYAYSPFGRLLSSAGPEAGRFAYRWQGREFDPETGLYDFRARLYDPSLMRFHAPDPAGQFASPYVFGGNV